MGLKALPWVIALVLGLCLFWSVRSGAAADERARLAGERADSLESLRLSAEIQSRQDSVALDSARTASMNRLAIADRERQAARRRALDASRTADSARTALAIVLDSAGVSSEALDALVRAHAEELAAVRAETVQADSIAATRLSLLQVTEQALASERLAHQATTVENAAIREQVSALQSGRRRDQLTGGVALVGALAVLILK